MATAIVPCHKRDYGPSARHVVRHAVTVALSSPSTIFRCLNRVALSFLTSWILSVDFLTSTWSFLLNMIRAAAGRGDRNDHQRRRPGRSASMVRARLPPRDHHASGARCMAHPRHVKSESNLAHTPPIRCT